MALSRVTTWSSGQTLTASALNGEFNNILNNALSLISPLTGNLNANGNQILSLVLEKLGSSPSAATEGRVWYETAKDQIEADDGTNIRRVPTLASVTTGDIIYASAANQWARLAVGSNGQVLALAGGIPAWSSIGTFYVLSSQSATFPTSNFPALTKNAGTNWVDYTLDFDQTTDETAYWEFALPSGASVTAANLDIYFRMASVTTNAVTWQATTLTRAEGEAWDTAGTTDSFTAETVQGTAGQVCIVTKALTVTGWAAGETLQVAINRDANNASDTAAEDAKFMFAILRVQ